MLVDAWRKSETFNELRLMPGLLFEGEWENQALVTRDFLLDLLQGIPVRRMVEPECVCRRQSRKRIPIFSARPAITTRGSSSARPMAHICAASPIGIR